MYFVATFTCIELFSTDCRSYTTILVRCNDMMGARQKRVRIDNMQSTCTLYKDMDGILRMCSVVFCDCTRGWTGMRYQSYRVVWYGEVSVHEYMKNVSNMS